MSKVCVIGCGLSGLTSTKACLEEGLQPVCYESCEDIGGLWNANHSKHRKQGPKIYPGLITNISKEMTSFSDFPMPKHYPMYLTWQLYCEYLKLYAENFGLYNYIRFQHTVVNVEEAKIGTGATKWKVTVVSDNGKKVHALFDKVMICGGSYRNSIPKFTGIENFAGKVIHSSEVDCFKTFGKQNVLIVGAGNTGCDMAVEIGRVANRVYLSRRGSVYITPRRRGGWPFKMLDLSLFNMVADTLLPRFITDWFAVLNFNRIFDHKKYGFPHEHSPFSPLARITINDEIDLSIASGQVKVVADVKFVCKNSVHLIDGKVIENIDVILCATGYQLTFPFISSKILPGDVEQMKLYKGVVLVNVSQPGTIAVIGVNPLTYLAATAISEMQARYAVSVFSGFTKLPSTESMMKECWIWNQYFKKSGKFKYKFPPTFYATHLAKELTVYPYFFKLFFSDPLLAFASFFGPHSSYIYRIIGKHNCPQIRSNILNIWKNSLLGLNSIK